MASVSTILPPLTTAEYKEIYELVLARYHGRENVNKCILKCLSQVISPDQKGLHVLIIGPGIGEVELKLLGSYQIEHLTAIEPSREMADVLETNLRSSSAFIATWNIHRTNIESYLIDKNNNEGPFDIILMIHSLYYPSCRGDVVHQLRSRLRPTTGRLILVHVGDNWGTPVRILTIRSPHGIGASDIERDLRDVNIPFDRHINDTTFDITDVKGNDKLEWAIASFFLGLNAVSDGNNLVPEVITILLNMVQTTEDGRLLILTSEHVFIIQPTN